VNALFPLLEFFRRGEVARDVRLMAARGTLAPRAHEQLAILVHLVDDSDPEIRETAEATIARIPESALAGYLGRSDVPIGTREFFADRGVFPAEIPAILDQEPLIDLDEGAPFEEETSAGGAGEADAGDLPRSGVMEQIARMGFTERLRAAMKGSREMRAILIRDPNKMVAASVLSSPKVTEQEIETFARIPNISEDVLRTIGSNRGWVKNYGILAGLTKNPKTPVALSLNLMARLTTRDLTLLSNDRNVPEPLRIAARKRVVSGPSNK
jgi:hypothetical protein